MGSSGWRRPSELPHRLAGVLLPQLVLWLLFVSSLREQLRGRPTDRLSGPPDSEESSGPGVAYASFEVCPTEEREEGRWCMSEDVLMALVSILVLPLVAVIIGGMEKAGRAGRKGERGN